MIRKTLILLVAVIACVGSSNHACAHEPVDVRVLSSETSLVKGVITIGDIAKVTGTNRRLREQISKLDLDSFSARKKSVKITRKQIQVRMVLAGISASDVRLQCPERISIRSARPEDFQGAVENSVRNELAQQFGLDVADVQIRLINKEQLTQIQRSINTEDFSAMIVFPPKLPVGDRTFRIDFNDGQGNHVSASLTMQVVVLTEVLVTNSRIPKGSVIRADFVQTIKRPMSENTIAIADTAQCIGCTAARDIPPHEVLTASYLTKARVSQQKLLRQNDFVDVVLQKGPVSIRLKNAKVLTAGSPGEIVQVLNTNTNKRFTATVKDKTTVLVR